MTQHLVSQTKKENGGRTKAQQFYCSVLGWKNGELPVEHGTNRSEMVINGKCVGGFMPIHKQAGYWLTYITVDNVDARVAKARKAGGLVHMQPMDMPGIGRMAIISDPQGGTLALVCYD